MATSQRIQSVDALRGIVMIVMALDHIRDFVHGYSLQFSPEDLTRTTAAIFFTRWITHFCAPVFMFTAGLAAFFWMNRGRTKAQLSSYLVKRGLWLILLELTLVRFALTFGVGPWLLTILWGIGWAMLALALLIHLPVRVLAVVSVAVIALHNLADPITAAQFGRSAWVWNFLHQLGAFNVAGATVAISYPLIPWFAVMSAGFCFGQLFTLDSDTRRRWMIRIGLALTAAFFVIRSIDIYGDPFHWTGGILSFLRCNKYPPSLDYLLMTLGPAIFLLGCLDRIKLSSLNPLLVFGRAPLFYFLAHLYMIHLLSIGLASLHFGKWTPVNPVMKVYPPGYGYDLWVVYAIWIAIVAMLYPMCLWFSRIESRITSGTRKTSSSQPPHPSAFWRMPGTILPARIASR
jgi:uncharacterized membrane protein